MALETFFPEYNQFRTSLLSSVNRPLSINYGGSDLERQIKTLSSQLSGFNFLPGLPGDYSREFDVLRSGEQAQADRSAKTDVDQLLARLFGQGIQEGTGGNLLRADVAERQAAINAGIGASDAARRLAARQNLGTQQFGAAQTRLATLQNLLRDINAKAEAQAGFGLNLRGQNLGTLGSILGLAGQEDAASTSFDRARQLAEEAAARERADATTAFERTRQLQEEEFAREQQLRDELLKLSGSTGSTSSGPRPYTPTPYGGGSIAPKQSPTLISGAEAQLANAVQGQITQEELRRQQELATLQEEQRRAESLASRTALNDAAREGMISRVLNPDTSGIIPDKMNLAKSTLLNSLFADLLPEQAQAKGIRTGKATPRAYGRTRPPLTRGALLEQLLSKEGIMRIKKPEDYIAGLTPGNVIVIGNKAFRVPQGYDSDRLEDILAQLSQLGPAFNQRFGGAVGARDIPAQSTMAKGLIDRISQLASRLPAATQQQIAASIQRAMSSTNLREQESILNSLVSQLGG